MWNSLPVNTDFSSLNRFYSADKQGDFPSLDVGLLASNAVFIMNDPLRAVIRATQCCITTVYLQCFAFCYCYILGKYMQIMMKCNCLQNWIDLNVKCAKWRLLTGGKSITGLPVVISSIFWRLGSVCCCPVAGLLRYILGSVCLSIVSRDLQPGCDTGVQWLQKVLVQSLFPVDAELVCDSVCEIISQIVSCLGETCLVHLQQSVQCLYLCLYLRN